MKPMGARRPVRSVGLRVTVAALGAAMGAMMLVVPHEFAGPHYAALRPHLVAWGAGALAMAVALFSVTLFATPRAAERTVLVASGAFLLWLGVYFAHAESWGGLATFWVLGGAIASCAVLDAGERGAREAGGARGDRMDARAADRSRRACDLLALSSGLVAVFIGLTMAYAATSPTIGGYDAIRAQLPLFVPIFVIAGTLQAAGQVIDVRRRWLVTAGHLLTGGAFVAYVVATAGPDRAWTGVLVFGAFAAIVAAVPLLGRYLKPLRKGTLRTRLAFALFLAASLPLIGTVAMDAYEDREATSAVLTVFHRFTAEKLARDVASGLAGYQRATASVAAAQGLFSVTPDVQEGVLRRLALTPEPLEVTLYGATGEPLARRAGGAAAGTAPALLEKVRVTREPAYEIVAAAPGRPVVRFVAPAFGTKGEIAGFVAIDVDALSDLLGTVDVGPAARVYLLDGAGHATAYAAVADGAEMGDQTGVAAVWQRVSTTPATGAERGMARYADAGNDWLAGYARVPDTSWTVVVERPETVALAQVYDGHERTLGLLAAVVALAVAGGVFVASRLAAPLQTLAVAVEHLGAGETGAPLPESDVEEVAYLARSFGQMRVQLAERAAERERAAEELRAALTELREAEQHLVQQERLRAVGQLASGIAHDLNNALAPVVGFTELVLLDPGSLTPVQLNWLRLAHTGALDAVEVLGRLREVYRARSDGEPHRPVDLRQLVEQVVALTRPRWRDDALAQGRTMDVRMELPAEPVEVMGSASELREAVTNLMFNAVDATQGENVGTITLRVSTDGERGELSVTDNGIGMSESDRRRCLEPFFTTKGERGTGLGLSMLHGTMERHGGMVEIESVLGTGSTFRLRLPLASKAAGDGTGGETQETERPLARRILVVDDEDAVREVLVACLEVDGHTVESAGSPHAAMDLVASTGPFDLVITDRAMPGMPGDALASWLKERHPGVPIIMVTGYGDLMNAVGERPAAVDAVLAKPVTTSALRAAVSEVVASAGYASGTHAAHAAHER